MRAAAGGRSADTIFALASAPGRGAIAVVRLSGAATAMLLAGLCRLPAPRRAALRTLRAPDGAVLDQALVLWMPGPGSYTGEDTAELHLHGGRAVVQAVSLVLASAGARPAEPGEFTRRAFLAGRMSLLEAEAIADLSASETETQRIQALRQMQGGAAVLVAGWSDRLTRCLAFQEALIDFPDDELPADVDESARQDIASLSDDVAAHLRAAKHGERVRSGLTIVIAGPPNAGKSSLFNALVGRNAAIVSPWPGTTRDTIEAQLDLDGIAVTLVDTAGLRVTDDEVEGEGVRRAQARIEAADSVLLVGSAETPASSAIAGAQALRICSKSDLARPLDDALAVSTVTGEGIETLFKLLAAEASRLVSAEQDPLLSHVRHVTALSEMLSYLRAAQHCGLPEMRAEELRLARAALGRLGGQVDTEEVLDVVFGAFCIGK